MDGQVNLLAKLFCSVSRRSTMTWTANNLKIGRLRKQNENFRYLIDHVKNNEKPLSKIEGKCLAH